MGSFGGISGRLTDTSAQEIGEFVRELGFDAYFSVSISRRESHFALVPQLASFPIGQPRHRGIAAAPYGSGVYQHSVTGV